MSGVSENIQHTSGLNDGGNTKKLGFPQEALSFFSSAVCRVQLDEFVNGVIVTDLIINSYLVLKAKLHVVTNHSIP
ncbi:hypothetical protein DJ535_21740 [Citrobacter murliniae]|uniref:Uncharacterized protein n=1 Tax=Citrobacter murliniae TaxID=67829 RepID=A0ABY2PP23_9ENTR|nr:hypothetical protein DJ535_21740 [Citrobacter murliniae]